MRELNRRFWPYKVSLTSKDDDQFRDIMSWLSDRYGHKGAWNFVVGYKEYDFYFKNSKDAMMFTLRWT